MVQYAVCLIMLSIPTGQSIMAQSFHLNLMVMSGVEDGTLYEFNTDENGQWVNGAWRLTIGRREENDLTLRNDTFVSRNHAYLFRRGKHWWIEDRKSTNGTFVEIAEHFFDDKRITGTIALEPGQLFRVGRTWLRIQTETL